MPNAPYGYRAPYHSQYGANHYHGGYGYHRHYHYPYNRVIYVSSIWPYWEWPYWSLGSPYGWGYPYGPIFPDYPDNDNSQQPPYVAPPSDYNAPYQPQSQQEPAPVDPYSQQPSTAYRAPYNGGAQSPPLASATVTIVFKDGRPPEKIYNYVLTSKTLKVFDQPLHDIPVDQIDVAATAKVNREAGVSFSLPVPKQ
jgi:hypothetical protein